MIKLLVTILPASFAVIFSAYAAPQVTLSLDDIRSPVFVEERTYANDTAVSRKLRKCARLTDKTLFSFLEERILRARIGQH